MRKKQNTGKLSIDDMRKLVNKKAGMTVAHNLQEENPTQVLNGYQLARAGWILLFVADSWLAFQSGK